MANYRRTRSKQAMQKITNDEYDAWSTSQTSAMIALSPTDGFDDECIVKRLRVTCNVRVANQDDTYNPLKWYIIQSPTNETPVVNDRLQENLLIAQGMCTGAGGPSTYDHTITMRKLSGSSVWLILYVPDTFETTTIVEVQTALHYLED